MSRKRNHRMSPELRHRQRTGKTLFINPADLMDLNRPMSPSDVDHHMLPVKAAQVRLMEGGGTKADATILGNRIDVAAIRLDELTKELENHEEVRAALWAAGDAIKEAARIHETHGKYGLTGPGRHQLQAGIDAYEAILAVSSPRQMRDAEDALERAVKYVCEGNP